ncbi:MAG: DNA polymerase III subunit gamma/tau [Candidatus Dormibacteraeota bacterium]|nr:DNA polymerase III subunit gamma/tau [Candidatus Dormibacteraeota bacterium]
MTTALYRRYRPARFAELVGQDVVAQTLRNEVASGSMAHAYLFAGTRGTGKTSTARILARAVNCLHPQNGEPDNECGACREILDGASVDVLEIDAASNRGIDEMRDLREKVKYLPASLQRKVYIIDEAHMLTTEAWNAFLKTLEEPPEHVLFVLATTEPHKVPDTVRSRVQRFDFRRVSTADIATHVRSVVDQEHVDADADALQLIAEAAQGSVRDALSLLEQAVSSGERPISVLTARRALGLTDPAIISDLMRALAGSDAAGALRAAATAFSAGADPRQVLREVARLARAAELHALGYSQGAELSSEESALCAELAAVAPAGFWLRGLELFAEAEMNLRQPVDARLQVELCLLRMLRPAEGTLAIDALESRVAALERGTRAPAAAPPSRLAAAQTPTASPARSPVPTAASAQPIAPSQSAARRDGEPSPGAHPADAETVVAGADPADAETVIAGAAASADTASALERWRTHWQAIIEAVGRVDMMLAGVLRDCRPVDARDGVLVVGASHRFHMDTISKPEKTRLITDATSSIAGAPMIVETRYTGEETVPPDTTLGVSAVTQAVLQTFEGSRVVATRLREDVRQSQRAPRG